MREHALSSRPRNTRLFNSGGGAVPIVIARNENSCVTQRENSRKNFSLASQFLSEDDDSGGGNGGIETRSLNDLCQDPVNTTVDDVLASLATRPKQAVTPDENGRKPLLHAIRKGLSLDIIKVLFEAYPSAMVEQDSYREVPLYMLYLPSSDSSVLEWVLKRQPSLTQYRRQNGSLTLVENMSLPWERAREREFLNASVDGWKKMIITIRAAHAHLCGGVAPSFEMPKLHVMLEYTALAQSTSRLLCCFLSMYEDQVAVPMSQPMLSPSMRLSADILPLHYFLATTPFPARRARQNAVVTALEHLLKVYPAACAEPGPDGRYPLHLALKNGYTWDKGCISKIVLAFDSALDISDPGTNRFPFLLADDLSDIFALLRENPMAVEHARLIP